MNETNLPIVLKNIAGVVMVLQGSSRLSTTEWEHALNYAEELIVVHEHGQIIYANKAAKTMFESESSPSISGTSLFSYVHGDDVDLVRESLLATETAEHRTFQFRVVSRRGIVISLSATTVPGLGTTRGVGMLLSQKTTPNCEVTATLEYEELLKEIENTYEERLNTLVYQDSLTSLWNRRASEEALETCLTDARGSGGQFAVLFLDGDRFKRINDSYGHPIGDLVLQAVAERLQIAVCDGHFVGRMGGDEFVVIMKSPGASEDVTAYASKILDAFRAPLTIEGLEITYTTSIGIALYPEHGETKSELLAHADEAQHMAKQLGKNQAILYSPQHASAFLRYFQLERALETALKNDEFTLCFQPQVDIRNGSITGAETLLRWHHPELGSVSPSEFIPVLEQTRLITPVTEWVLREASLQFLKWRRQGLPIERISVNVSGADCHEENLFQMVNRVLDETGIPAVCLELEITETAVINHLESMKYTFHQLKQLGVRIAIDDFGTGTSSLSYLRELPITTVKIDQSFIQYVPDRQKDSTLVKDIIQLAHNLGLEVLAEGVETEAQLAFLIDRRCDLAQGYLFGRPVSPEALGDAFQSSDSLCRRMVASIEQRFSWTSAALQRELYRSLHENNPYAIVALNRDGKIVTVNPAAVHLAGYPPTEVVGIHYSYFVVQEDVPVVEEVLQLVIRERQTITREIRIVDRWKKMKYIRLTCFCIFVDSTVFGMQAILTDITEERANRERLDEQKQALMTLFDESNEYIVFLSVQPSRDVVFSDVNSAACRGLGYSKEEFLRLNPRHLVPEERLSDARKFFYQLETKTQFTIHWELVAKDGRQIPVELRAYPIYIDGTSVIMLICRVMENAEVREEI